MYDNVSRKIKFVRAKMIEYTQDYMAKKLSISQNAYCKIENGQVQPTLERLKQIADVFKMSIDEMLNVDEVIVQSKPAEPIDGAPTFSEIHNHNDVQKLQELYEQLIQQTKEKYELQIELLKTKLNNKN